MKTAFGALRLLRNGSIAFGALAALATRAPAFAAGPVAVDDETVPYVKVDNLEGDWVNLMNPPYRPMVLAASGEELWVVDNHNNQVHYFDDVSGNPAATWGVPAGPVSIAKWSDGSNLRLIVVCRTSWVVCMLDATTGRILDVVQMEDATTGRQLGEPADIVVIGDNAYVSCSASDAVAEIDLQTFSITGVAYLPSKHPTFLSVDGSDVLVVPQASGNNTFVHVRDGVAHASKGHAGELGIIDGGNTSVVVTGLNDYDVFRIDWSGSSPVVTPVAQHVGTSLFAHAIHPSTGKLWVLNTEANTKDPAKQSEPTINGVIAFNRLSLTTLTSGVATPFSILDLDLKPNGLGGFFNDPAKTVGQPFNLGFGPGGIVFIVGQLTDNVTVLDSDGDYLAEWNLTTAGSIPRAVLYSPQINTAFVYCWGTNVVEGYLMSGVPTTPWVTLDLGLDPTPPDLKEGRTTLFDAGNSLANRFSCLTCHVDGGFDGIAWNLGTPTDDKGPMLTQSLRGLETVHPFHWRGEQEGVGDQLMVDFNAAFANLMGGTELDTDPGEDWDHFEDFVFSMQQPANPNQNIRRRVDPDIHAQLLGVNQGTGDAVIGQGRFTGVEAQPLALPCASCHSLPKGTSNDFIPDGVLEHDPHQMDFKVAPFQEDYRWEQDANKTTAGVQLETVDFVDSVANLPNTAKYPPLGGGFTHAGLFTNLHDFVGVFTPVFSLLEISHVTDYIHQWDNGLAPVAHRAYHVDDDSDPAVAEAVEEYLVDQCTTPTATTSGQSVMNGDFAAIGTFEWQSVEIPMRWYWDPATSRLIPEDSSIPPQTLATLLDQADQGESATTFIGMPYGTARRFAVDYDGDGLFNADELDYSGTNGNPDPEDQDSDGDGWWDGYEVAQGSDPTSSSSVPTGDSVDPDFVSVEVLWTTAKTAVVRFETTEQSEAVVTYVTDGGSGHSGSATSRFGFHHRVVLANLDPDQLYDITVEIADHWGNTEQEVLDDVSTDPFGGVQRTKVGSLSFTTLPSTPTSSMTLRVMVADRLTAGTPVPLSGYRVAARLFLDGRLLSASEFNSFGQPEAFKVNNRPYVVLAGGFVMSPAVSDSNGFADLTFAIPGAQSGDVLSVVIEVVQEPTVGSSLTTDPKFDDLVDWSHSDTPNLLRTIHLTL